MGTTSLHTVEGTATLDTTEGTVMQGTGKPEEPEAGTRQREAPTDPGEGDTDNDMNHHTDQGTDKNLTGNRGLFSDLNDALFGDPWEMWVGAILISILSTLLFIIASPLGSIGGLNNWGQNYLDLLGVSFDGSAPSGVPHPTDFLYAMLILATLLGAFGSALLSKEFAIRLAPKTELMKGLIGGILMGIGGSIGMGCTITGFYSSLPALSAGGLFFGSGLFIGVFLTLKYFIWEAEHLPFMTSGKWITYLTAPKQGRSWQPLAGVVVLALGAALIIPYDLSREQSYIGFILIGLLIGVILQRSRFCIFRAIREPFLTGDPRPAQAIILGLLVGLLGFTVIKGMGDGSEGSFVFANFWIPGLTGGIIFGIGMTAAGGCSISATWRAGEGHVKLWMALVGILISMPLSGEYLKPRFLDLIPSGTQQAEFLPDTLGYGGAVLLILFVLFLWYVILKWNERDGILLLIGRPDGGIPWPARKDTVLAGFIALLLLSGTLIFAVQHQYWSDDDSLSTEEAFRDRIEEFLFSGRPSSLSAPEVEALLTDGYAGNDPYIISLRNETLYELGHIPGAKRMSYDWVFSLSHYDELPRNRLIVVYDDIGHESAEIASLLNIMGLFAVSIEWGMPSWTPNTTIAPEFYQPDIVPDGLPIVNGGEPGALTRSWFMRNIGQCGFVTPPPREADGDDEEALGWVIFESLKRQTRPTISPEDLHSSLTQSTPLINPFILDLRSPPRYQKGHIPGAVNMDLDTMFKERSFESLPEEGRTIVVIADTPHLASQARAYFDILGYSATALEYGMASWTSDPGIAPVQYDRTTDCHNYPVAFGPEGGSWNSAEIAGKTREEILKEAAITFGSVIPPVTSAPFLFHLLNDTDPANDPMVLSLQESDLYDAGHIPGAERVRTPTLFSRDHLIDLAKITRSLVIVDSDGQEASEVSAFMDLLGFQASYLQYGMCGWTTNTTAAPQPLNVTGDDPFPAVNGSTIGSLTNETPPVITPGTTPTATGLPWDQPDVYSREWDILRQAIQDHYSDRISSADHITSEALYYDLIDDFPGNDPYLISIQSSEEYLEGHIPGAQDLDLSSLLYPLTLSSISRDTPVLLISSDGERAAATASLLSLIGIDSLFLRHGMSSWNYDAVSLSNPCVDPTARVNDFPLATQPQP